MHVIGSDRIAVTDGRVAPAGVWHAVDADGLVACRDRGPAYTFPALIWPPDGADGNPCPACRAAVTSLSASAVSTAYPAAPGAPVEWLVPDSLGF
jgi:hypothetical protein